MPEVAYKEERYPEIEHVNRGIFDAHMKRIDQRADHLEQQMNERFDRMQNAIKEGNASVKEHTEAIIERKLARQEAFTDRAINEIRNELKEEIIEMKGDIKSISVRLDALQSWYLPLFGVIMTIIIAAIQFLK